MDIVTIIYIIIAFVVGTIFAYVFKKEGKNNDNCISDLISENDSLKEKLSFAESKVQTASIDSAKAIDEIRAKYDTLLKEANEQCEKLDKQLMNALNGKLDDSVKEHLAEVEKLKKKVKDLEEDIEEKEDDVSDLKKKIKNKETDISDLQDSLGKEQKISKELKEELSLVKQTLDEKVEELKLKMGSLDFIQEILSAKEIKTEDSKILNKNIDFFESFVKGQFTDLNAYLYTTYKLTWMDIEGKAGFDNKKKYFHDAFDQWASTKRKSWLNDKTTIAFVGEFSAGKTSIVNRILSQDNPNIPQLPVSTKATTAIPTYIAGGSEISYTFISGDEKRKVILEDTFKKVSKEILDQVKGVSSLIKYFVMTYKNPNLNGLSILDTPGFNSNDSEDRERTIDVINECDALFWVVDVNTGTVNRSSIEIIKEKLNKPLYIVINKVDQKLDSEVKKVEDLIKETLTKAGLQVQQFIRFSSEAPLSVIMDPIKGVKKIASRDTFVSDVGIDIKWLMDIFDEEAKTLDNSYNSSFQEGEKLTDEYIECIRELRNDCVTAADIPQWSEGVKVFGIGTDDKFVMTPYEGNHLIQLLSRIAEDRVQTLANKFYERVDKAAEVQQAWSDLCDLKAAWQKVNDCFEQYKKVSKNIA